MEEIKKTFSKVVAIIENAKKNAYRKVNEELINMYWCVGQFISEEAKAASYGDSFIDELSKYIQDTFPGIKGFNRRGLYRMKQFYETYANYEKVSPLVTQINWTNNLLILSGTKSYESDKNFRKTGGFYHEQETGSIFQCRRCDRKGGRSSGRGSRRRSV